MQLYLPQGSTLGAINDLILRYSDLHNFADDINVTATYDINVTAT